MISHIGIDYGSKLAGTTCICWSVDNQLMIKSSKKKQDADTIIVDTITQLNPQIVCIDCPMGLPSAYYGEVNDFFYRECDKQLKAMSPMFLGGLTARGMKLKHSFQHLEWLEVYPKALVESLALIKHYQKKDLTKIKSFTRELISLFSLNISVSIDSWHAVDSILAWISGTRFISNEHTTIGRKGEGLIIV